MFPRGKLYVTERLIYVTSHGKLCDTNSSASVGGERRKNPSHEARQKSDLSLVSFRLFVSFQKYTRERLTAYTPWVCPRNRPNLCFLSTHIDPFPVSFSSPVFPRLFLIVLDSSRFTNNNNNIQFQIISNTLNVTFPIIFTFVPTVFVFKICRQKQAQRKDNKKNIVKQKNKKKKKKKRAFVNAARFPFKPIYTTRGRRREQREAKTNLHFRVTI